MAFKLIEKDWNPESGEYRLVYMLDSVSDVADLPKSPAGSKAYAPASGKEYVSTCSGDWYEVQVPAGTCDLDTMDATATDADMVDGKTTYVNGVMVTGTIPSKTLYNQVSEELSLLKNGRIRAAKTTTEAMYLPAGANIYLDTNPAMVGDATATDVAVGKTFTSAAGVKVEGTVTEHPAGEYFDIDAQGAVYFSEDGKIKVEHKFAGNHLMRPDATLTYGTSPALYGDATSEDVCTGKTFTSTEGLKVVGHLEEITGAIRADFGEISAYEDGEITKLQLVCTIGTSKIMRSGSKLYIVADPAGYGDVLGDATAADVRAGKTFTSAAGLKVVGTWDGT